MCFIGNHSSILLLPLDFCILLLGGTALSIAPGVVAVGSHHCSWLQLLHACQIGTIATISIAEYAVCISTSGLLYSSWSDVS